MDGERPNTMDRDEAGEPVLAPLDENPDGASPMENDLDALPPEDRDDAASSSLPPGSRHTRD